MLIVKEVKSSNNTWIAMVSTTEWDSHDINLMTWYGEPTVNVGGTISDGTVNYSLTTDSRYVKTQSPFIQQFNPTDLGISLFACSERAVAFNNVMTTRIESAMTTLRNIDSTSLASIKYVTV